jgi:hypothetical protein
VSPVSSTTTRYDPVTPPGGTVDARSSVDLDPPRPSPRRAGHLICSVLLAALLLTGAAGQIRIWASGRGLWNDEIYIANNLKYLGVADLLGQLLYFQVAPPGWLAMEQTILNVFGPNERVLKVPEVVAAIVVLLLTAVAAYRAIGRWASLVAVGLIVTAPQIHYYAGELKQYVFEAAVAMVIVVAAGAYGRVAVQDGPTGRRRVIVFAAVTTLVSVGSYSSLVVLAGVAGGIGLLQAVRRRWSALGVTVLAVTPGLAVGGVQAWLRWRLGFMSGQQDFFPHGFPPEGAGPVEILRWLPELWQGLMTTALYWRHPLIAFVLVVGGLASLVIRRRPLWAAMIAGVFLAAVGAAALRGLPAEGRVALYLVAPIAIAVVAAVDGAVRGVAGVVRAVVARTPAANRLLPAARVLPALLAVAAVAGLAVVVQPATEGAYRQVEAPGYRDDGRDKLREVASRLRPGDVVVAYYFSEPMMTWYGRQYDLPMAGLAMLTPQKKICDPAATVDQRLAGAGRVWYFHAARLSWHPDGYNEWVVGHLARRGTVVERREGPRRAGWTLIDLAAGPDPSPPPIGTDVDYACLRMRGLPAATGG